MLSSGEAATKAHMLLQSARDAALRYLGVVSALVLLVVWQVATEDQFATTGNVLNILQTNAALLVVAVGMTFVMLVGGFDLSMGGLLALSGVVLASMLNGGVPPGLAIVVTIAAGILIGLATNGLLIAAAGLSFFVVTIGTAAVFRGIALVMTDGSTQGLYDQTFLRTVGSGEIGGVPWIVIIALGVFGIAILVTRYTGYGRMLYAVGGNPEAARLAGINVVAVRLSVYAIAGGLAALAGILTAGRLASAAPDVGVGIELTAGAAVLIGGTSFLGGSGGMAGTLLGVLFLGVLANALTLADISAFWQGIVSGCVLVVAILIDRVRQSPPTALRRIGILRGGMR